MQTKEKACDTLKSNLLVILAQVIFWYGLYAEYYWSTINVTQIITFKEFYVCKKEREINCKDGAIFLMQGIAEAWLFPHNTMA